jgi:hypothetical protein
MKGRSKGWIASALVVLSLAGFAGLAQASAPRAHLEPDTVAPGEASVLVISADGDASQPEVGRVPGLSIEPMGQRSNITIMNGTRESSVDYLYQVSAARPGDFSLNSIRVNGRQVASPTLHVSGRASANAQTGRHPASATAADMGSTGRTPSAELAFLRVQLPKKTVYVGESVPVRVRAYFRAGTGVSLSGRPEIADDAFVLEGFDAEPTQAQVTIEGVPYLKVEWKGRLSAVKPGRKSTQVSLPAKLEYREQPQVARHMPSLHDLLRRHMSAFSGFGMPDDSLFDSLLDDSSLFDDSLLQGLMSSGPVVKREVTLKTPRSELQVSALPREGKPENFTGAIGTFDLTASVSPEQTRAGEPVELSFAIQGTGNFGHFRAPRIQSSDTIEAYAEKRSFKADDELGLRGRESYSQPLVALTSGHVEVPPLTFSYFDPNTGTYVTKSTRPITIEVAPGAMPTQANAGPHAKRAGAERGVHSLMRAGTPDWVWPSASLIVLAAFLASALLIARRTARYASLVRSLRASRVYHARRKVMERAAKRGDRTEFLRAARSAIQARLASLWELPESAITTRELDVRWPEAPAPVRRAFELADEVDYGGATARGRAQEDLEHWTFIIDRQLKHVEKAHAH